MFLRKHAAFDLAGALSPAPIAPGQISVDRLAHVQRLANAVTGLAVVAALAVALALPSAYYLAARTRMAGALEARAQIYAEGVLAVTEQSPALWNAMLGGDSVDLTGFPIAVPDDPQSDARPPEQRRVMASTGRLILDVPPPRPLAWPTMSARAPVIQSRHPIGEVEIIRSFRPMLVPMLWIAAGALVFGLLLLTVFRLVPLRLLRLALDHASYLSAHDLLTALPNRALFGDRLEQALAAARREQRQVALLSLDLDQFKIVNDTLGYAAGDTLLQTVAARLSSCLRESDTLARLGGDEFAVIQPGARQPRDAEMLATRLIDAIREPFLFEAKQVFVGLSIGIALSSAPIDAGELVKQADMALHQAKQTGRGGLSFFAPEMNARLRQRWEIEHDLRAASAAGQLSIYYQPQVDLASGAIVGAEALMRWTRPGAGAVPPATFIPVAEETGLIGPLGGWLLGESCREAAGWPANMQVAVNVSPVQFRLVGFLDTVRGALAASGLDPHRLELEVTEGILLNDTDETLAILASLRRLGVRLAMDDFGTGYASLGYLQKFHFDKIKIDRSFVENLGSDPNAEAIVRAVVGLSEALGMVTNAEGVETQGQRDLLRAHGCQEVQGFLYWAPMPAEQLRQVLTRQSLDGAGKEPPAAL